MHWAVGPDGSSFDGAKKNKEKKDYFKKD